MLVGNRSGARQPAPWVFAVVFLAVVTASLSVFVLDWINADDLDSRDSLCAYQALEGSSFDSGGCASQPVGSSTASRRELGDLFALSTYYREWPSTEGLLQWGAIGALALIGLAAITAAIGLHDWSRAVAVASLLVSGWHVSVIADLVKDPRSSIVMGELSGIGLGLHLGWLCWLVIGIAMFVDHRQRSALPRGAGPLRASAPRGS